MNKSDQSLIRVRLRRRWSTLSPRGGGLLSQYLFPKHVFRIKKVLVFGAMEDIRDDKYLATS